MKYYKWKMAIARSLDWTDERDECEAGISSKHLCSFYKYRSVGLILLAFKIMPIFERLLKVHG